METARGSSGVAKAALATVHHTEMGLLILLTLLVGACTATEVLEDGGIPDTDRVSLSDRTRIDFGLDAGRLDSIQFFLDRPVTYAGMETQTGSNTYVEDGVAVVDEEQEVRVHRVHIEAGTPGVAVGYAFPSGADADGWEYIDVDFGGFLVRFEAGRGGSIAQTGDPPEAGPSRDELPILYYAPAATIHTDSLVYRLDRRTYTGATLTFLGSYRYTRKQDTKEALLPGRVLSQKRGAFPTESVPDSAATAVPVPGKTEN